MTSIDDVARSVGVSTATVSRALRGLPGVSPGTRARVESTANRLGYVPSSSASGLASGRTMAMGVLLPLVDRWFFSAMLDGVDRRLRAAGYDLIVFSLGGTGVNRERVFSRSILRKRIDALLVMCMELTPDERRALQDLDSPSVVVGGSVQGMRGVSIDDDAAMTEAVEYLIGLGHTRIAHLRGGDSYGIEFEVPRIREEAFNRTMRAHGLRVRTKWDARGNFRVLDGKAAAGELLKDPLDRPTAILCSSDEMAFGALLAAGERGIAVPGELSVMGIDDHEFAEPMGLTTIAQRPEEQGAYAAGLLLDELAGEPAVEVPVIQPHLLVLRSSTGPPRPGP
ncbi:LacI family DNA-binding transcriptional regulator [Arthrobacter sp. Br18]|uniref:LacI family DNA-binding transcriptional regulator n=1 Tax=Arthrobacter sp. Br18 TaxID=1312954 RepID=UPI0004B5F14B|nr:LacI family DNA-binding transcriptional regulator [Arthrobacter sp. Br18]